jgi:hypothetical protein
MERPICQQVDRCTWARHRHRLPEQGNQHDEQDGGSTHGVRSAAKYPTDSVAAADAVKRARGMTVLKAVGNAAACEAVVRRSAAGFALRGKLRR